MSDILDQAIESLLRQNHSPSEVQAILRQKWEAMASPAVAQPRSSDGKAKPTAERTQSFWLHRASLTEPHGGHVKVSTIVS